MYEPSHFKEDRLDVLHQLIRDYPLGALVTAEGGALDADHVPFEIAAPTLDAPHGILRAHVARANPLAHLHNPVDALVLFQGASAYITPAWYEEKQKTGKVVPTYNYAVVHAHGPLRVIDDTDWLLGLLTRLTARHEARRAAPWAVGDAPPDYIAKMMTAIVGIEIPIARLTGKWKVSQNRNDVDRAQVAAGLGRDNAAMAALVRAK